jgi:hypothetical protein
LVVVGDLIGPGSAQEQSVVGETPNLAARLQGIAEPNAVVIAESTRRLLGNLFELQDLGGHDLKDIGSLVRAWAVLRPASVESRFEALHASGLTELVAREEELEILLRRWSKAKSGQGQVVLLLGEAGVGKSRLTAALLEHLDGRWGDGSYRILLPKKGTYPRRCRRGRTDPPSRSSLPFTTPASLSPWPSASGATGRRSASAGRAASAYVTIADTAKRAAMPGFLKLR